MSSVLGWAVIQRRQKVWQNWHTFTPSGQARPGQARQPAGLGEYSGYIHTYVHTYLILRATYVLPCNIWMSSVYTRYTSTWSNPSLALYVALFSIIVYMYYVLCIMYTTCLCVHVCTQYTYNCRTPSSAANVAQHSRLSVYSLSRPQLYDLRYQIS